MLAHHHMYLYAIWLNISELFVYRSPLVRDSDDMYVPVRSLLNTFHHKIKETVIIADPDMMFGTAEQTVYQIGERIE